MARETEKLKLTKPAGGDYVDVDVLNENFDKIDGALTDDVAGNSTSTTKYPSAKGVWDTFLPRTGGTLSGELTVASPSEVAVRGTRSDTDYDACVVNYPTRSDFQSRKNGFDYHAFAVRHSDAKDRRFAICGYEGGAWYSHALYGEHNLKSSKIRTECNSFINNFVTASMTTAQFLAQMEHNTCIQVCSNFTNDIKITDLPFNYGMIVFRKGGTESYQTAIGTSTEGKIYVYIHTGHSTDAWQELGGGGMRVPIAYGKGSLLAPTGNRLNLSGKGTVWLYNTTLNQRTIITIDGGTPLDTTNYITLGLTSGGVEAVPFDFEKSIKIEWGSTSYALPYTYQLYK